MNFAHINGCLLHYRLSGPVGAPVLTFVNSLGTDARIWDRLIDRLNVSYRCLSFDKRGHGLSDSPAGEYRLEDHLDDLEGLLAHTDITRTAIIGVSIGGLIAQGLALRAPERIAALVLCNTAPRLGEPRTWTARIEQARADGLEPMADDIMARWFSPGFRSGQPHELRGWRNLFLRTDVTGYAATCATLRDADLSGEISAIEMPTLVIAGDADLAAPVELVRTCLAIPASQLKVLAGVGHLPPIERPALLSDVITEFLQGADFG